MRVLHILDMICCASGCTMPLVCRTGGLHVQCHVARRTASGHQHAGFGHVGFGCSAATCSDARCTISEASDW